MQKLADWRITHSDPTSDTAPTDSDAQAWIAAAAPGDVHQALHAGRLIPDPLGDRTEEACRWVEERVWWWRTSFAAQPASADERIVLEFDGLDTFATIWLNGAEIGQSSNMFLGLSIDVTHRLRANGENQLMVRFDPPATRVAGLAAPHWPGLGKAILETKRNMVRKAQFGWGWDWGPRVVTVGIWQPVRLRRARIASVRSITLRTLGLSDDAQLARCRILFDGDVFRPKEGLRAKVTLHDPDGAPAFETTRDIAGTATAFEDGIDLDLPKPRLWWTHDLGAQPLYRLTVALLDGDTPIASTSIETGIRTIALDMSADPVERGATFFRFVLNGRPLFAKGACWIPADSLLARITPERYQTLVEQATTANMNMIRVWGGGIYEADAFYDACDRMGVLVWQDFMFACAPYPEDDEAFNAGVDAEVRYQIERLRHHPSIALWCGNNENQFIQNMVDDAMGAKGYLPGTLFYERTIPAAVKDLDPAIPYWPGSPFGGAHANSMKHGDVHNWTVWHGFYPVPDDKPAGRIDLSPQGVDHRRYAIDMCRFVSEFGIQASPNMESLKRQLPADEMVLGSAALMNRIKDNPKNKIDNMMVSVTGLPQTIEQYVDFSQITQAEGLKFAIEHYRRRMPHCSGALIWQLNDCWPGISWSLVDYFGFEKAGYHYVRRAFAPVMASFKEHTGNVELWITNDTRNDVRGTLAVELCSFFDGVISNEDVRFAAPANSSTPVWRVKASSLQGDATRVLTVRSMDDVFPANRHFFASVKDLVRPREVNPSVSIAKERGALMVTLEAPAYLYLVQVHSGSETTRYSDNFFDLKAGERRVITLTDATRELLPEDVTVRCC